MPYCPECGNEVSITDKRCSKCGYKLAIGDFEDMTSSIAVPTINKSHHNIEFALSIIAMVLWVFSISQSLNSYAFMESSFIPLILIILFIGIIGAIVTRYFAKPGAIIVLIVSFALILFGATNILLPMIFSIIAVIVAFVLN